MNERIDMKKIMFNDKYGLTQAVLDGRKTQTRRIINLTDDDKKYLDEAFDWDLRELVIIDRYSKYKVGDEVAIAQSYRDAGLPESISSNGCRWHLFQDAGWFNKMFVRSEFMPHRIRIKNIRVEKLNTIVANEDDCIKEGIKIIYRNNKFYTYDDKNLFDRAWIAFANLIDKINGRGTWNENPYVFVCDFELIK